MLLDWSAREMTRMEFVEFTQQLVDEGYENIFAGVTLIETSMKHQPSGFTCWAREVFNY